MKQLTSEQLRTMYLEFFKSKGHALIPGASLIPENDPSGAVSPRRACIPLGRPTCWGPSTPWAPG